MFEVKEIKEAMSKMKKIECPYCQYDGSDLKIGINFPYINNLGVAKMRCKKCGREFNLSW